MSDNVYVGKCHRDPQQFHLGIERARSFGSVGPGPSSESHAESVEERERGYSECD